LNSGFGIEALGLEIGASPKELDKWFKTKLNEAFPVLIKRLRVEYLENLFQMYGGGLAAVDYARFSGFPDILSMNDAYWSHKGANFPLIETHFFCSKIESKVSDVYEGSDESGFGIDNYYQLKIKTKKLAGDFEKFYKSGNKAAGTRLRKGLMDIGNLCQDLREDILEKRKR